MATLSNPPAQPSGDSLVTGRCGKRPRSRSERRQLCTARLPYVGRRG
jgi:hypothetical protein